MHPAFILSQSDGRFFINLYCFFEAWSDYFIK